MSEIARRRCSEFLLTPKFFQKTFRKKKTKREFYDIWVKYLIGHEIVCSFDNYFNNYIKKSGAMI